MPSREIFSNPLHISGWTRTITTECVRAFLVLQELLYPASDEILLHLHTGETVGKQASICTCVYMKTHVPVHESVYTYARTSY